VKNTDKSIKRPFYTGRPNGRQIHGQGYKLNWQPRLRTCKFTPLLLQKQKKCNDPSEIPFSTPW